jgi:hypothetical protein
MPYSARMTLNVANGVSRAYRRLMCKQEVENLEEEEEEEEEEERVDG